MSAFTALGLSTELAHALDDLAIEEPTPVQAACVPVILLGADVLATAETGSGKTAAFVLPLLHILASAEEEPELRGAARPLRALVIAPTRELAAQIAEAVAVFARYLPIRPRVCLAVGGVSINPQMLALRGGADIVVATPGRLLDLVDQRALRLSSVEILVLDEADQLLSLGFSAELARVLALLPKERQNLLFSATFPPALQRLAGSFLRAPRRIDLHAEEDGKPRAPSEVHQRIIEVDVAKRTLLLRHLLETEGWESVLVFVESQYKAEHVADKLGRAGVAVATLHGGLSQGARAEALRQLRAKRLRVLVATDLAGRGLDIVGLPAVVSYDLPRSAVDYLHRVGRTGRAGEAGMAVSFVSPSTAAHLRIIERRNGLSLPRERLDAFPLTDVETAPPGDPNGGVKGKRKSKKDKAREATGEAPRHAAAGGPSRPTGGFQ